MARKETRDILHSFCFSSDPLSCSFFPHIVCSNIFFILILPLFLLLVERMSETDVGTFYIASWISFLTRSHEHVRKCTCNTYITLKEHKKDTSNDHVTRESEKEQKNWLLGTISTLRRWEEQQISTPRQSERGGEEDNAIKLAKLEPTVSSMSVSVSMSLIAAARSLSRWANNAEKIKPKVSRLWWPESRRGNSD